MEDLFARRKAGNTQLCKLGGSDLFNPGLFFLKKKKLHSIFKKCFKGRKTYMVLLRVEVAVALCVMVSDRVEVHVRDRLRVIVQLRVRRGVVDCEPEHVAEGDPVGEAV